MIDRWARRADAAFLAPLPPERLAAMRVLVAAFTLIYLPFRLPGLLKLADFPVERFHPVGLCALLDTPPEAWLARLLVIAPLPLAVPFALGWRHRVTGPLFLAALAFATSFRSSFGMIYHSENLLLLHAAVLAFAPAADAWSLDARRRGVPATPRPAHGWTLRLLLLITALSYFLAGVAKLRLSGLDWAGDELLRHHVAFDNLRKAELGDYWSPLGGALVGVAWVWPPLAWGTLLLELGAPLFILHRRAARAWAVAMYGFHLGILTLMFIPFHYPLLGVAFAPLFPLESIRRRPRADIGASR